MLFHRGQVAFLLFQLLWEDEEQSDEQVIAEEGIAERAAERAYSSSAGPGLVLQLLREERERLERGRAKASRRRTRSSRIERGMQTLQNQERDWTSDRNCANLKEMELKQY